MLKYVELAAWLRVGLAFGVGLDSYLKSFEAEFRLANDFIVF